MQSYEGTYGSEAGGAQPSRCQREACAVVVGGGGIVQPAPPTTLTLSPRVSRAPRRLAAMASAEHKRAEPRVRLAGAARTGSRTHGTLEDLGLFPTPPPRTPGASGHANASSAFCSQWRDKRAVPPPPGV